MHRARGRREHDDPFPDLVGDPAGRSPPVVSMDQPSGMVLPIPLEQAGT